MLDIDKIQATCKGNIVRNRLRKLKDGIDFKLLNIYLQNYKNTILEQKKINIILNKRKIRMSNFPESISENIVKFAIFKKYNIMPNWDTSVGDLEIDLIYKKYKIEVKGGLDLSKGPSSFGPNAKWDIIYFIDAKNMLENIFTIYEIKLSNNSLMWKNLEVSKDVLWKDFIKTGKRPRFNFNIIKNQLPNCKINKIFEGNLNELDPKILSSNNFQSFNN